MFTFSDALVFMKEGQKVQRSGWNNQRAYVSIVFCVETGGDTFVYTDLVKMGDGNGARYKHAWLASHLDMLANDWNLVKETKQ